MEPIFKKTFICHECEHPCKVIIESDDDDIDDLSDYDIIDFINRTGAGLVTDNEFITIRFGSYASPYDICTAEKFLKAYGRVMVYASQSGCIEVSVSRKKNKEATL